MKPLVREMLHHRVWAVVGASANREKFGNRIYRLLKRYGYQVYAVNPRETAIEGDPCYASVKELPVIPDAVDIVVPPLAALDVVEDCAAAGVKDIWFQLGVESEAALDLARELGLRAVAGSCVMVESSKLVFLRAKRWAVVGASRDTAKAGNLLIRFLREQGYAVTPINPKERDVEGIPCYPRVSAMPQVPEVVDIVAPPAAGAAVLADCAGAGVRQVWFQPGAESEELIALAVGYGMTVVHHACAMDEYTEALEAGENLNG